MHIISTKAVLRSTHTLSAPFMVELAKFNIVAIFDQALVKQKKTPPCHRFILDTMPPEIGVASHA
jgi:hypothetical protein